jgi:hypothetical protein
VQNKAVRVVREKLPAEEFSKSVLRQFLLGFGERPADSRKKQKTRQAAAVPVLPEAVP